MLRFQKGACMKNVYLIGFRGTGFQQPEYVQEPSLIRAGHVGFAFEDDPDFIFGFHPTAEAIEVVGGEEAAIEWLKDNEPLEGMLFADLEIFVRADVLHDQGASTVVWQVTIALSETEYERIRAQTLRWYNEHTKFVYAFPQRGNAPLPNRDNCATFPRRLGLPIPESTGQLTRYILVLEEQGVPWKPRGG